MTVLAIQVSNHSVVLDISGADPVHGLDPDQLELAWSWRPADGWRVWRVRLSGPKLKKDGTPGLNRAHYDLRYPSIRSNEWKPDIPIWALNAVHQHAPVGTP